MAANTCRKSSLTKTFAKQNYFVVRPFGVPENLYHFFGYREHVNVFLFQYHGYAVYPCTKEFDAIPISSILGNVTRVIARVYSPLMANLEYISYMSE